MGDIVCKNYLREHQYIMDKKGDISHGDLVASPILTASCDNSGFSLQFLVTSCQPWGGNWNFNDMLILIHLAIYIYLNFGDIYLITILATS